ncbi:MAG: ugpQ [Massilia sp.]|nr:ugpQ [Massilia sp.]
MWPYPRILAHRGGGKLAPENTIAALRCGLEHGFRAVEFDVMLARDGVPVVLHDPFLGRTVAGSGNVFDYDAAELQAMDAGAWFASRFAGEPVPLFAEVVDFCRAHGIWMNIEIKPAPGFERETGSVVAGATGAMFSDGVGVPLLSSFSETALAAARDAAPELPRAVLFDAVPPDWQARAAALGAVAIHCNHSRLDGATAAAIKAAGFGLFCYTVNNPARARALFAMGVDGLCTDRLDLIAPDFA